MSSLNTAARLRTALSNPVVSLEATQTRVQHALRAFEAAAALYDLLAENGDWGCPDLAAADEAMIEARWAFQDALADLAEVPFSRLSKGIL